MFQMKMLGSIGLIIVGLSIIVAYVWYFFGDGPYDFGGVKEQQLWRPPDLDTRKVIKELPPIRWNVSEEKFRKLAEGQVVFIRYYGENDEGDMRLLYAMQSPDRDGSWYIHVAGINTRRSFWTLNWEYHFNRKDCVVTSELDRLIWWILVPAIALLASGMEILFGKTKT